MAAMVEKNRLGTIVMDSNTWMGLRASMRRLQQSTSATKASYYVMTKYC